MSSFAATCFDVTCGKRTLAWTSSANISEDFYSLKESEVLETYDLFFQIEIANKEAQEASEIAGKEGIVGEAKDKSESMIEAIVNIYLIDFCYVIALSS